MEQTDLTLNVMCALQAHLEDPEHDVDEIVVDMRKQDGSKALGGRLLREQERCAIRSADVKTVTLAGVSSTVTIPDSAKSEKALKTMGKVQLLHELMQTCLDEGKISPDRLNRIKAIARQTRNAQVTNGDDGDWRTCASVLYRCHGILPGGHG